MLISPEIIKNLAKAKMGVMPRRHNPHFLFNISPYFYFVVVTGKENGAFCAECTQVHEQQKAPDDAASAKKAGFDG
ncbi:hypothetical protein [Desulfovibrio sp. 3_1_syn3]|uniref:hypothetical protein n=1 Tax=Desulfovibrio sp. 3_1_syn3 TaxID=457398 RepID=UPI0012EB9E42|nr:hypothetical protein [Desulfovibrio sp. 3_1_syn3]